MTNLNPNLIKVSILGTLSVIAAGVFGYALSVFIVADNFASLYWVAAAGALFMIIFVMETLALQDVRPMFLVIAGDVVAMSVWFFGVVGFWPILVATIALTVLLWTGYRSGVFTVKNVLQIKFMRLGKPIINHAATGLAIFGLILYFASISFADTSSLFFNLLERSVDVAELFLPVEITQEVPPAVQEQLKNDVVRQLYDATFGALLALPDAYQNLILLGIGILMFVTLRGLLFFADGIILLLGAGVFSILRKAQFFKVAVETQSKEILTL